MASGTTQLLEVHHHIGLLLDVGKQIDIIYMALSNAFEKVDHTVFLNKVQTNFLICGNLLSWLRPYLLGWRQRVTLLGTISPMSGVPRGFILGPIFFPLWKASLMLWWTPKWCHVLTTLSCTGWVDSTQDAILLQNDLDKLEAWCISSGLVFNQENEKQPRPTKKCKQQHITRKFNPVEFQYKINDKPLEVTNHEKDLGV